MNIFTYYDIERRVALKHDIMVLPVYKKKRLQTITKETYFVRDDIITDEPVSTQSYAFLKSIEKYCDTESKEFSD